MGERLERILIVDDEENVCALFKRVMEKEGYEAECASSGEEGLEKRRAHLSS